MKKVGLLIFIFALAIGLVFANMFSFGKVDEKIFNFSINGGVKGSGNTAGEKRHITDFNAIDAGGMFQVEITAQEEFSVEIEADDNLLALIKTEVSGGVLRLETEKRFSTRNPIRVRISAPDIEKVQVSGASKVSLANISNENLRVDSSGASKITISGATERLTVDSSGASKVNAENLKSENVSVDSSGASHVRVFAVNEIKTDASGASKIIYSGSPKNLIKKTSGAGSVKEK